MAGKRIGEAFVRVRPETRLFTREATQPMQSAGTSVGATFGSFFATAFAVAGGVLAAAKLKDFLMGSIGAASDLNETISKVGVVFGGANKAIIEFSKTSKTSIGQSQQSALDAAATFGVFGKSAGLTGKRLSDFSLRMVRLTSDMASFSNTTPEEAIEAVGAALRGESEPIRRYGVLLDDATLRQAALRLGIIKTTKDALTPAQKVLAAQAEILRQTKDAQGDFGRTASGAANQQRILNAQWADTKTKVGAILLPAWQSILTFANTKLIPMFEKKIVPALQRMGESFVRDVVPRLREFGQWVGDEVLPRLRDFSAWVEAKIVPVVMDLARRLREDGIPVLQRLRQTIEENRPQLEALWSGFRRVVDFIVEKVLPVVGPMLSNQLKLTGAMFTLLIRLIGFLVDAFFWVKGVITGFVAMQANNVKIVAEQWGRFVDLVRGIPGRIADAVGNLKNLLVNAGKDVIQGLVDGIASGFQRVKDKLGELTRLLPDWKGPAARDRRLLFGAGASIIDGLGRGMASRIPGIRGLLGDLTTTIGVPGGRARGGGGQVFTGPINIHAYSDRFSLSQVMHDLALHVVH